MKGANEERRCTADAEDAAGAAGAAEAVGAAGVAGRKLDHRTLILTLVAWLGWPWSEESASSLLSGVAWRGLIVGAGGGVEGRQGEEGAVS